MFRERLESHHASTFPGEGDWSVGLMHLMPRQPILRYRSRRSFVPHGERFPAVSDLEGPAPDNAQHAYSRFVLARTLIHVSATHFHPRILSVNDILNRRWHLGQ